MSLGLLLQMNPNVSELALYDIQGTPGVACDISHINSKAKTKACPLNGWDMPCILNTGECSREPYFEFA